MLRTLTSPRRLAALVALLLVGLAGALFAARPQSYSVRDVVPGDIRSVCIVAQLDEEGDLTGLREEWTIEAFTTTGAPLGFVSMAAILPPPPGAGTSQIVALMQSRLAALNARLDAKYPETGIPNPLATEPAGKGGGGRNP